MGRLYERYLEHWGRELTHILGFKSPAVHLPVVASLSSSSSPSFGILFYEQIMCSVICIHGRYHCKLERLWDCGTLGEPGGLPSVGGSVFVVQRGRFL